MIDATVDARWATWTGFNLTDGQIHDLDGAKMSLPAIGAKTTPTNKGFDADVRVLEPLARAGTTAVIPPKRHRTDKRFHDKHLYQARHLIENFFGELKQFRAIAIRYDKTARNFLAAIHLATATI